VSVRVSVCECVSVCEWVFVCVCWCAGASVRAGAVRARYARACGYACTHSCLQAKMCMCACVHAFAFICKKAHMCASGMCANTRVRVCACHVYVRGWGDSFRNLYASAPICTCVVVCVGILCVIGMCASVIVRICA
jgi:hypothetical protein